MFVEVMVDIYGEETKVIINTNQIVSIVNPQIICLSDGSQVQVTIDSYFKVLKLIGEIK